MFIKSALPKVIICTKELIIALIIFANKALKAWEVISSILISVIKQDMFTVLIW